MRTIRRRQWGKIFLGSFIGSLALGATAIDVWNNHDYGVSISQGMAAVMVLAALGLTAIPGVAAIRGWSFLRVLGTVLCLIATAYCAVNAYAARQSAAIMAAELASTNYQDARAAYEIAKGNAATARQTYTAIAEPLPVLELERLHREAETRVQIAEKRVTDESTDPKRGAKCGDNCRAAERERDAAQKERDAFSPRIAQAKAKAEAKHDLNAAEEKLKKAKSEAAGGDAEPNMIAAAIATRWGGSEHEIARFIALMMSFLGIAVTLAIAGYMHDAVSLIAEGVRGELIEVAQAEADLQRETAPIEVTPAAENPALEEAAVSIEKELAAGDDRPVLDPGEWLKPRLRANTGGCVFFDDLLEHYQSDASEQGMRAANKNAFSRALKPLGFADRGKNGTRVTIRNASLKPVKIELRA